MDVFENLQRDIEIAFKLLHDPKSVDDFKLYPWSNERIYKYNKYYDLNEKKVLCITGSGDHALHAICAGAKNIDCIDINPLAKYFQALKITLIIAYDETTFFNQIKETHSKILNPKLNLNDLKPFLNEETFIFWNEIINSKIFKKNKRLFRLDGMPNKINLDYNNLKDLLPNVNINYYDADIKEYILKTKKKYDAIFLSNIMDWEKPYSKLIIDGCMEILNNNGVIYDTIVNRKLNDDLPFNNLEKTIITDFDFFDSIYSDKGIYVYRKK